MKWKGLMGHGDIPLDEIVAVRLFEKKEDKSFPDSRHGDTVFIYPNANEDGTLVRDSDTYYAGYKTLLEIKDIFAQAKLSFIPMEDKNCNEFLVNP